jgi:hypothetical protein
MGRIKYLLSRLKNYKGYIGRNKLMKNSTVYMNDWSVNIDFNKFYDKFIINF